MARKGEALRLLLGRPVFHYSYHDEGTNRRNTEQNFGVVHYDYSPKPCYRAYQGAAAAR